MKKFLRYLAALVFLALAPAAHAAPTIVHNCTINEDGSGSDACTIASVSAGNQIVAFSWTNNTSAHNFSFTDTFGLSYVQDCEQFVTGSPDEDFVALTANTGANSGSDTFTQLNHQFAFAFVIVMEISGLGSYDTCAGANGTTSGSQSVSTGNLTTAFSGEYLIAGAFAEATNSLTVGSGYTQEVFINGGASNYAEIAQDKTAGAAGSYSSTDTVGATSPWQAIALAFVVPSATKRRSSGIY